MAPLQIFVVVFIFVHTSSAIHIPSWLELCKYSSDPVELGDCMRKEHTRTIEKFMNGVPELHMPPYDPYFVEKLKFEASNNNNAVSFTVLFTNLYLYGGKDVEIQKLSFDVENAEITGESTFPYLHILGDYQLKGNILVLPLDSFGKAEINFTEVHTLDKYTGKKYTKNGKEYIQFDAGLCDVSIKGLKMYFDNVIRGNAALTKSTNAVFNENSQSVIDEMKFVIGQAMSRIRINLLNSWFTRFSIDELLPQN